MATMLMTKHQSNEVGAEIIHWTWDENPDESYCGLDMSGHDWMPEGTPVNCPDCIRIDEICDLYEMMEDGHDVR